MKACVPTKMRNIEILELKIKTVNTTTIACYG